MSPKDRATRLFVNETAFRSSLRSAWHLGSIDVSLALKQAGRPSAEARQFITRKCGFNELATIISSDLPGLHSSEGDRELLAQVTVQLKLFCAGPILSAGGGFLAGGERCFPLNGAGE